MITIDKVTKYYGTQQVLKNISFTVDKGEMAFITGKSGSGKTTVLRLMLASESLDEGEILIDKYKLSSIKRSEIFKLRRIIGFIFQDFKLKQDINIFDNIAIPLRLRRVDEKNVKILVIDALKKVHLRHKSNSYPITLSGGEQQRVGIARALVANPLIILADEPTGNLDSETSAVVMQLFAEINIQGTSVIIATHNKELFKDTGKKILELIQREPQEEGI